MRLVIGTLSLAILLIWIGACFTDINFPSHARTVRLLTACVVLAIGFVETRRPWLGFQIALIGWPQGLLLRLARIRLHSCILGRSGRSGADPGLFMANTTANPARCAR